MEFLVLYKIQAVTDSIVPLIHNADRIMSLALSTAEVSSEAR